MIVVMSFFGLSCNAESIEEWQATCMSKINDFALKVREYCENAVKQVAAKKVSTEEASSKLVKLKANVVQGQEQVAQRPELGTFHENATSQLATVLSIVEKALDNTSEAPVSRKSTEYSEE